MIPSLARLGRLAQLGDMPTFIAELGREVETPSPARMRVGGPLAAIARDHARQREALGFAPREVVTEFLLLRRVLWRFVATRVADLASGDVIESSGGSTTRSTGSSSSASSRTSTARPPSSPSRRGATR